MQLVPKVPFFSIQLATVGLSLTLQRALARHGSFDRAFGSD